MDIQKIIKKLVKKDLERCEKLHGRLSSELERLEEGSITERKGFFNWCRRENGRQYCTRIKDPGLLFRLRKRQFIKKAIPILQRKIQNDRRYLEHDVIYDPVELNRGISKQYQELKNMDIFLEGDINFEDWIVEEYRKGEMFSEGRIYKVDGDTKVRSKSEAMIAMRLQEQGFNIRYESAVAVGDQLLYPDFDVLLPNSRRVVYYEHFGMIDNPVYAENAFKKLKRYSENGIILGYNLVITFETKDNPLTLQDIDNVIDQLKCLDKQFE